MTVWVKGPAGGAFRRLRYSTLGAIPPVPTNFIGGGTEMTAPNQAVTLTQQIANAAVGSTVTAAPGIHMLDFRASGQLMVCILLKSGVNFDFSQAELRLRPGQATVLDRDGSGSPIAGTTSSQWADIITNQNTTGSSQNLSNVTIKVGCLNGRAAGNQGNYTGTNPDLDNGAMYDGISLRNPSNCVIEGGFGPWSRGPIQSDGLPLYLGVIKNMRGWDGGGGDTESFHYTFDGSLGTEASPNIARRLEVMVDDGATRSASGGSSNGGARVLHEDIVSHDTRAQGMTSWRTNYVTYRRINSYGHGGSGFRNEESYGNRAESIWSHDNTNQGYNIKGSTNCTSPTWPEPALVATDVLITDNNDPQPRGIAVQQNSVSVSGAAGIIFSGRWGGNRINGVSSADNLCQNRASTAADVTGMSTVTTWTDPLPS